jgi:hypothetical protein
MDTAKRKAGVPDSLSRKEKKANKRRTSKIRRQLDSPRYQREHTQLKYLYS